MLTPNFVDFAQIHEIQHIIEASAYFLKYKNKIAQQIPMSPRDFVDFGQPLKYRHTHAGEPIFFYNFYEKNVSNHDCMLRSRTARTFALKWETNREKKSSFHEPRAQKGAFRDPKTDPPRKSQISMGTVVSFPGIRKRAVFTWKSATAVCQNFQFY